jgi:hypothetical protein
MTGIIITNTATGNGIIGSITSQRVEKQKGEPGGSPFCFVAESLRKRAEYAYVSRATRTAKAV